MSQRTERSCRQGHTAKGPEGHSGSQGVMEVSDLEGGVRRCTKQYLAHRQSLLDNKTFDENICLASVTSPLWSQCGEA